MEYRTESVKRTYQKRGKSSTNAQGKGHRIMNTLKGSVRMGFFESPQPILSIIWSPSGRNVAFFNQNTFWLFSIDTNQTLLVQPSPSIDAYYSPDARPVWSWSPNEKYLAILQDKSIIVWNASKQQATEIKKQDTQSTANFAAFAWSTDSKSVTVVDSSNIMSRLPIG